MFRKTSLISDKNINIRSLELKDQDVIFIITNGKCKLSFKSIYDNRIDFVSNYRYFIQRYIDVFKTIENIPIIFSFQDEEPERKICCFSSASDIPILLPDPDSLSIVRLFKDIDKNYVPYNRRKNSAIWRGASTGNFLLGRGKLCKLSNENPSILNAKITSYCQNITPVQEFSGKYMNVTSQIKYKIMIDIDGNSNSWSGLAWKLYSDSIVLKVESPYKQWYYDKLIPWMHYIPVKNNLEDLIEKISWILKHDKECEIIGLQAHNLVKIIFNEKNLINDIFIGMKKYANRE